MPRSRPHSLFRLRTTSLHGCAVCDRSCEIGAARACVTTLRRARHRYGFVSQTCYLTRYNVSLSVVVNEADDWSVVEGMLNSMARLAEGWVRRNETGMKDWESPLNADGMTNGTHRRPMFNEGWSDDKHAGVLDAPFRTEFNEAMAGAFLRPMAMQKE